METLEELKRFYDAIIKVQRLKNLSGFLFLNLLFMFVEIMYGIWTNSLGLLTDGAHMLLDCSAILIGIYSCYLVECPKTKNLEYGYKRSEVLGTFVNSVFLIFIAIYIVFESFERFFNPKEIISNHLIMVSFLGLLVNLVGIFALHDFSSGECNHHHTHDSINAKNNSKKENNMHSSEHGHSHNNNHEHDHECSNLKQHDHSKDNCNLHDYENNNHEHLCLEQSNKENSVNESSYENIRAIYIHIVADALGSVSVLISSFFVEYYGLNFTDPLCSILISLLILYSSYPVLKSSFLTLVHLLNLTTNQNKLNVVKQIQQLSSNISINKINFYNLNSDFSICELSLVLNEDKEKELSESEYQSMIKTKIKLIMHNNMVSESYIDIKYVKN